MPAIVVEKPKISRPMWNALKSHIIRERQRKKQEQEADAEVERQRREREDQQKEQEMTLEETKEQVAQSESRLAQLKEDKHQLFLQLKKVLNEDDTRRKIKESNFNDMVLFHPYHPGAPLVHSATQGSAMYMPNLGTSRPVFNGSKDEPVMSLQGAQQPSLYGQSLNLISSVGHQAHPKRSRSPSPPPQLYHTYKPPILSPYNSKSIGNQYGGVPAVPGSIFYTHSVSVSAASGGYQLPPGAMYSYTPSQTASRQSYPVQNNTGSKEDLSSPKHHAAVYVGQGQVPMAQSSQRSTPSRNSGPPINPTGYHHQQPLEHMLNKNNSNYGSSDPEKFLFSSSHGPTTGPSNTASALSTSSIRSHPGLLAPHQGSGSSHPSGIPIQQQNHPKSGSIITGNPLRPPPSTSTYHTAVPVSHAQSPRLAGSQSSGQSSHPNRYYGTSN